jgi:hypothetical protein
VGRNFFTLQPVTERFRKCGPAACKVDSPLAATAQHGLNNCRTTKEDKGKIAQRCQQHSTTRTRHETAQARAHKQVTSRTVEPVASIATAARNIFQALYVGRNIKPRTTRLPSGLSPRSHVSLESSLYARSRSRTYRVFLVRGQTTSAHRHFESYDYPRTRPGSGAGDADKSCGRKGDSGSGGMTLNQSVRIQRIQTFLTGTIGDEYLVITTILTGTIAHKQ